MMLLTANDHGCHKVAEWSRACSGTPRCYLDTVLCECSQLGEAVEERSGLHLRAAACTGAIAYNIRKGVPVLVSASWWTPPDHYGGPSDRDTDILGRTSRSWGHRERESSSHHMTDTDSCVRVTILTISLCHFKHSRHGGWSKPLGTICPHINAVVGEWLQACEGELGDCSPLYHPPPPWGARTGVDWSVRDLKPSNNFSPEWLPPGDTDAGGGYHGCLDISWYSRHCGM